jgi:hypothetical protein
MMAAAWMATNMNHISGLFKFLVPQQDSFRPAMPPTFVLATTFQKPSLGLLLSGSRKEKRNAHQQFN